MPRPWHVIGFIFRWRLLPELRVPVSPLKLPLTIYNLWSQQTIFIKRRLEIIFFLFVSRSVCTLQYRYFNNLSFFGGMLLPVALIPMIAWLLLWSSTRDLYWPFTVLKATPLPNNWKLSAVFEFQYNHKIQCRKWVWSIWMSQFEFYVPLSFCLVFVKWDTPLHTKSHDKYEQTNNNKH